MKKLLSILILLMVVFISPIGISYTLTEADKVKAKKFESAIINIVGVNDTMYVGDGIMQVWVSDAYYKMNSSEKSRFIKSLYEKWNKIDSIEFPSWINLQTSSGDLLLTYPPLM